MLTNFKENWKLITVDLSKQNAIDADLKAIQEISFQGVSEQKSRLYNALEKSKEAMFKFDEVTAKVL